MHHYHGYINATQLRSGQVYDYYGVSVTVTGWCGAGGHAWVYVRDVNGVPFEILVPATKRAFSSR